MPESPSFDPSRLDRRHFLRRMGLAAGAVIAAGFIDEVRAAVQDAPKRKLRVIILGAGLAGLCAAYELERQGHEVVLLEAETSHVGGRVRTLRFENGLYGEAGAMRIPLRHELTRRYVREFELPLRRFVQSNPDAYLFARGQRERMRDVMRLASRYGLLEAERGKSPDDLWNGVVGKTLAALSASERTDLSSNALTTEGVRRLDQLSLQQLFEQAGLSPQAIEFLAVAYGQEAEMIYAVTESLREELKEVWSQEFHEIVGGTDRLPTAFAAQLCTKPRMGCEVIRVEQDPVRGRTAAIYRTGGHERREEGDFVLCTLPFPVVQRLVVDPAFSQQKQRAIRQLSYDSSTKILAMTKRRFWEAEDGIYGGGTFTDLPTGTTWYPSSNAESRDPAVSAAPSVMLASYTWGQAARRLAALSHSERSALALRHLELVHPQLAQKGMVRRTASWSWDNHRWSGGAFAWFLPGQHSALHQHVVAPEGRIFFAGEHTSLTHTWMQGALESALRAVQAMVIVG